MEKINKQAIAIIDENSLDVQAILLVDTSVDPQEIQASTYETKKRLAGKWTVSDIVEGISVDFQEVEAKTIYVHTSKTL